MNDNQDVANHWREWRERCAAALCEKEAQAYFAKFGQRALEKCLHYNEHTLRAENRTDPLRGWHELETFMHATSKETGKRWKDWLFARLQHTKLSEVNTLESGARICLRSIVKKLAILEGRRRASEAGEPVDSIQQPIGDDEGSLTVEDLLAVDALSPAAEAELREFVEIAKEEAAIFFATLEQGERVVLAAVALRVSLDEDALYEVGAAKRDKRYELKDLLPVKLRRRLHAEFEGEAGNKLSLLDHLAQTALSREAISWARSEKRCEPLFFLGKRKNEEENI